MQMTHIYYITRIRSAQYEIHKVVFEDSNDLLTGFDEELFAATVERITVYPKKLTFLFKDGSEIDTAL